MNAPLFPNDGMPVIHIPQKVYRTIAEELLEGIDGCPDGRMVICRDNGAYGWEYTILFHVSYLRDRRPDGDATLVGEIVPLWSEFHAWFSDEGEEFENDFDAERLRDYGVPYNKPFTTSGVRTGTRCASHP